MKTLYLADWFNFYCKDTNEPGPAAYKKLPPTHTHPFNGPFSGTTWVSRYDRNCIKMHEIIEFQKFSAGDTAGPPSAGAPKPPSLIGKVKRWQP